MKLCLIHTPFSPPSSVPLGVACLKSFLEREVSDLSVITLDLNLEFHDRLISRKSISLCPWCPIGKKSAKKVCSLPIPSQYLKLTRSVLKDGNSQEFYRPAAYARIMDSFQKFFYGRIQTCYRNVLKSMLNDSRRQGLPDLFRDDIDTIVSEKPDVVGFSVFSTDNLLYSLGLAIACKKIIGTPVVLGGPLISSMDTASLLVNFPEIDFIVRGEGEIGVRGLIDSLNRNVEPRGSGLVYRKGNNIVQTPAVGVKSLDELPPPDFSDLPLTRYYAPHTVLPLITSRGCYWSRCAFCTHSMSYSGTFRSRSINLVVDEIERNLHEYRARHFKLADEMISPSRLKALSDEILKRNLQITFSAYVHPTAATTHSLLQRAHEAGLRMAYWGIESATQRILDAMGKGTNAKEAEAVLNMSSQAGIKNYIWMIYGFPTQTMQEIINDMNFLKRNRRAITFNGIPSEFGLERGSKMFANPDRYHVRIGRMIHPFEMESLSSNCFSHRNIKGPDMRKARALVKKRLGLSAEAIRLQQTYGRFREHALLHSEMDVI